MVHTTPLPCRHHHHGHDLKGGSVWEWGLGCCDPSFPRAVTLTQKALCLLWALSDAGEEPSFFFLMPKRITNQIRWEMALGIMMRPRRCHVVPHVILYSFHNYLSRAHRVPAGGVPD